jgi:hypothetical protein
MGRVYASRDHIGENSALSCSRLARSVAPERAVVRREVFPSGGTAWGDDITPPHMQRLGLGPGKFSRSVRQAAVSTVSTE